MDAYKTEKMNQIIEALHMRTTSINRIESKIVDSSGRRIIRALDDAVIGYFEWCEIENCVYMSEIALKYSGIEDYTNMSFLDQLQLIFDDSRLYKFLNNLMDVVSGKIDKVEFEINVDSKIFNVYRTIKFCIRREIVDGKLLVTGTAQDITEIATHVERVKKLLKANELLLHIAGMIDEKSNVEDMYREILNGVLDVVTEADKGCILLFDKDNNIYIKESVGFGDEYVNEFRIPFEDSFAKKFMNGNYLRAIKISHISENYEDNFPDIKNIKRGFKLESNITAPINVNGKLFGIISIDSSKQDAFDDIDLNLIDFLRGKLELSINRLKGLSDFVETSQRDELTGLYNRRYFISVIESMMSSVNENEKFSLVVFDLDDLKVINDSLGHLAGDTLIKSFVKVLRDNFRDKDLLARLGGDEFIGLFKNIDNEILVDKITMIEDILSKKPIRYDNKDIFAGFSYGISIFPDDGKELDDLFHIADDRMYISKSKKKRKQ